MKKILVLAILLISVIASGCSDKFAKEKEAITKSEQAAMAMKLPEVIVPDSIKKQTKANMMIYRKNFMELLETETKILTEMKKSDAKIAEMEKTASESEKKDLKAFKDKIQKARVEFVRKVSKGRLSGDTFIVGVGSTWQEVEMVYGQPKTKNTDYQYEYGQPKKKENDYYYDYGGLRFSDWYTGVPLKGYKLKHVSNGPISVEVTSDKYVSDAGIKMGMTSDEFYKTIKSKYVNKDNIRKQSIFDYISGFAMQDTMPYNVFPRFKDGKLVRYTVAPH